MSGAIPVKQRAILVKEIGKPSVVVDDHPVPQPGQGQIRIKVAIVGLNPHDQKSRDYGLFISDALPAVSGADVVGTVTDVAEGVTNFAVGDLVLSHPGFTKEWVQQGLQEYAVEDAAFSCKIPASISADQAATLPTNVIAGVVALFDGLSLTAPWADSFTSGRYKDTSILIVGGGSSCGKFGVQLAKLSGFGTIVVVGGDANELKELGATAVIDRHGEEDAIVQRIRDVVGDNLLYAYDVINPPSGQTLAAKALSNTKRGTLARLLSRMPGSAFTEPEGKQAGVELKNVLGLSAMHPKLCSGLWKRLPEYLESGQIRPTAYSVVEGLTAENVNAILDGYRDGKKTTKPNIHV